jgi:hypothetical protein
MSRQVRISAKNLGELALPNFCPRCFWFKLQLGNKLPFQIFPGIFSSIDAYTKQMIHGWFDSHGGQCPPWMECLGEISGYKEPPTYRTFNILHQESNVLLTGTPDGVLTRPDTSYVIVDYKTAKYTGTQDSLMPMYEVQLNAYAYIGERCGLKPVSYLALIYMEPLTGPDAVAVTANHKSDGFAMGFKANVHEVVLNPNSIPPLLAKTRELYEQATPPNGCSGCKDCQLLEGLLNISSRSNR